MDALVVGLGSIGQRHLRHLCQHDAIGNLFAYRSGHGRSPIGQFDKVVELTDLEACLDHEPELAVISNPTHLHVETAQECAEAGCDLLVEKPLSTDRDGIPKLRKTVEENELISLMGCNLRFHPILKQVNELLRDVAIGDVYSFRAHTGSYLPDWHEVDYRERYHGSREFGGGVVLDLIHEIDYAHWLFGPVARQKAIVGQVSHLELEAEDVAEIVIETEEGSIGSVHMDYVRQRPRRDLEVVGQRGVISANIADGQVTCETSQCRSWEYDTDMDETYRRQINHFLECVRQRRGCVNDIHEGAAVLDIALNAVESGW